MDNKLLIILCVVMLILYAVLAFPEGVASILAIIVPSFTVIFLIDFYADDTNKEFLKRIFIFGLLARLTFGLIIHIFDLREFFGGDALTYDYYGNKIVEMWFDNTAVTDASTQYAMTMHGSGMNYLIGSIYTVLGHNILAGQSFVAVIGSSISPLVFACSWKVFKNLRVSKMSAVLVALFPSFIIWTGQMSKDGLIIFLLVLCFTLVLLLQEKFSLFYLSVLAFAFLGVISLRFYIFFMLAIATLGSFLIGTSNSLPSLIRRGIAIIGIGLALTYLGVLRTADENLEKYGSLERVQSSRTGLSQAGSGFGGEEDVSTGVGALSAIPIGMTYLLLAPFPWELTNLRQAITLPDMLLWWSAFPFLFYGIWYAVRYRLRSSAGILIFTLMLTIAYSIFQGNVGTAYRQRTQIQVFMFIFISVGCVLLVEKKENKKLRKTK
jgi:4-amino-4-deoxy-L-arabinose transferase-like glycosyltransferase